MDASLPPKDWPLEALANKMQQYCPMLVDLSAETLAAESRGDYEALRAYLRRRGTEAYRDKVCPKHHNLFPWTVSWRMKSRAS